MKKANYITLDPSNKLMIGIEQLKRKQQRELNEKHAKRTWYLELAIAACLGAALAFGSVVIHQMLTTEWTW